MSWLKDEMAKYPPIDLENIEKKSGELPEDLKQSITLYNKAIESIKQRSEDIAIMELKKAISINPNFYEAMNLLGVCYLFIKEKDKAKEIFKNVVEGENNSVKALEYLELMEETSAAGASAQKINTDKDHSKKKEAKTEQRDKIRNVVNDVNNKDDYKASKKGRAPSNILISYAVVFLLGALALFLIQLPFKGNSQGDIKDPSSGSLQATNTPSASPEPDKSPSPSPDAELSPGTNGDAIEKLNALTLEYEKLKGDFDRINAELEQYKSGSSLEAVESLAAQGKYVEAADLLVSLRQMQFPSPLKEKYDGLAAGNIIPRATWEAYQEGMNQFNAQNFSGAAKNLEKVINYGGSWDYTADAYYSLGRSYMALEDDENALRVFNMLKEKYPGSSHAGNADARIAEIGR